MVHAAQGAITVLHDSPASQASGLAFIYTINYTCTQGASTDTTCNNMVITIPLPPPRSGWDRSLLSLPAGATDSHDGTNLIITLPPAISTTGSSLAFQLRLVPPDRITENGTTWPTSATLSGTNIPTVTSNTVNSTVTAATDFTLVKSTNGNVTGSVASIGDLITYQIQASCRALSYGNLNIDQFQLVDTLPNTVTYVSSNPPGHYDAGTHTVTWNASVPVDPVNFPHNSPFPAYCQIADPVAGITVNSTINYTITARINDGSEVPAVPVVPNPSGPIVNPVTATYRSLYAPTPAAPRNASSTLTAYHTPPPIGNILTKSAAARPLPNNTTFPGNWRTMSPGSIASEAYYVIQLAMRNIPVGYQQELYDPMPCRDNYDSAIGRYSSIPITGGATADPYANLCQNPAFHPEMFTARPRTISGFPNYGYNAAYSAGWRPLAILTDGSSVPIDSSNPGPTGSDMEFPIPPSIAGRIAMLVFPRHAALSPFPELAGLGLGYEHWVFGYADPQTDEHLLPNPGGFEYVTVLNRAYIRNYWQGSATASHQGVHETANFRVTRPVTRLGLLKGYSSNPSIGAIDPNGDNGGPYTGLHLTAEISSAFALESDVILTDLLPPEMTVPDAYRTNPADPASPWRPTIRVRVTNSAISGIMHQAEVPWKIIDNYLGTGRQLIRITVPRERPGNPSPGDMFPAGYGNLQLRLDPATRPPGTPAPTGNPPNPTPLYLHTTLRVGTYENTARLFAPETEFSTTCTAPLGGPASTWNGSDSLNESGYGVNTPHCQHYIEAVRPGSGGGAYEIDKRVRGNLDSTYLNYGTNGNATLSGGTARYQLRWTNTGGTALQSVVLYDLLPYSGDSTTGSENPRNSEFPITFVNVVTPLPTGVTVQYSDSVNACRPEVFPTQPAGCVNNWTTNLATLGGAANVRALKITSSQVYQSGAGFALEFNTTTGTIARGQIAYNNAAAQASTQVGALLSVDGRPVGLRGTDDSQLEINKVVDRTAAIRGDTLTYTITISNAGPLPAIGVPVADTLSADTAFVSASDSGVHDGSATGGDINWSIDLAANASKTLTVTVTVNNTAPLNTELINSVGLTNPPEGFLPPLIETECEADANRSCATTYLEQLVNITGRIYVEASAPANTTDDGNSTDPGVVAVVSLSCTDPTYSAGPISTPADGSFSFTDVPSAANCTVTATPPAGYQAVYTQQGTTGATGTPGALDTSVAGSTAALSVSIIVPDAGSTGNLFALRPPSDMTSNTVCSPVVAAVGTTITCTTTCTNISGVTAYGAFCNIPDAAALPGSPTPVCSDPADVVPGATLSCSVSFAMPDADGITVIGGTGASNDSNGGTDAAAGNNPSDAVVTRQSVTPPITPLPVPTLGMLGLLLLSGLLSGMIVRLRHAGVNR